MLGVARVDHRAALEAEPAAHLDRPALERERVQLGGAEQLERRAVDPDGEIGAPVGAKIEEYRALDRRRFDDRSGDDLKCFDVTLEDLGRAHRVERMRPDAAFRGAGLGLERVHFGGARAIVGKSIDPGHAQPQHLALNPEAVVAGEMREGAAVTIQARAPIAERHALSQR